MTTLRALECLVAVLDAGSVTGAATRLHASQPAVSHQLAALEREVGTPLLERLPRGVVATVAGRAVAVHARVALTAAQQAVAEGRATAAGTGGALRVGCAQTVTTSLLAPVLRAWRRRHPDVALTLTETTSADELAAALERGELDVAVGPRPTTWGGALAVVGVEDVVVAMPADHPLATRASVPWAALDGRDAVHHHPDNGLAGWLDHELAAHGVRLHVVLRTRQAAAAAELAMAGLGVALVPVGAVGPGFAGALRRLDPPLAREVVALSTGSADAVVRGFTAALLRRGVRVPAAVLTELGPERSPTR